MQDLLQLIDVVYVKRTISQSFQYIVPMIVCLIKYPDVTIVEKSGLNTGLVIDTYSLRLDPVNTRVGSHTHLFLEIMVIRPN